MSTLNFQIKINYSKLYADEFGEILQKLNDAYQKTDNLMLNTETLKLEKLVQSENESLKKLEIEYFGFGSIPSAFKGRASSIVLLIELLAASVGIVNDGRDLTTEGSSDASFQKACEEAKENSVHFPEAYEEAKSRPEAQGVQESVEGLVHLVANKDNINEITLEVEVANGDNRTIVIK